MRKIPEHLESPVDNLIYSTIDEVSELFYKWRWSPNMITTLSSFFGLLSVYLLYIDKFILAGIMYFISYYFDCLDGYYARKYNMVTEFGDYYDHFKDVSVFILLGIVLFKKKLYTGLLFFIPLILIMCVHFGCQEIYYGKNESGTLNFTKNIACKFVDNKNVEKVMKFTRHFGCGTIIFLFCIYIMTRKIS